MGILESLNKKLGEQNVLINEPMSNHTSFKIGGPADIFVKVNTEENLKYVLQTAKENSIPLFILGNGSNILVTDKGIRGIVCKIELDKFIIEEKDDDIYVTLGSRKQKC